jgi:hypothetical protein
MLERDRETRESGQGSIQRCYIVWGEQNLPALKVPRQYLLILLVKVGQREGKALRSEDSQVMGSGLSYEQRKEVEQDLYYVRSEF